MDPQLLRLYSDELGHLREVGAEFAREFPKIAARLGMEGMEVTDPYVERLLEGFAFLAARVQLKLESEQPGLIAHLLEATYPNFLAPLPSMMVARFGIDRNDPNLVKGYRVARGTALVSQVARGRDTQCEFRTAHEVTLWPVELASVHYFSFAPDLALERLPQAQGVRGGLRIRLHVGGGLRLGDLGMDRLAFYIAAPDDVAFRLHELVLGAAAGTLVRGPSSGPVDAALQWRGPESVRPMGDAAGEALLPESQRAFSGYRLLQETAALPQRFLFFEVSGLAERLARTQGAYAEIVVLLRRGDAALEPVVDVRSLSLFCTPAINLFPKRLDPVQVASTSAWQHHLVPDRTRPMDYEVHSLISVTGHGTGRVAQQSFLPLYATGADDAAAGVPAHGYYTVRREPRLLSPRQREHGTRSSYVGEEVWLSLVDPRHAPYTEDLRQLSVAAWVTNRDLPNLLPPSGNGGAAWRPDAPGPIARVDVLRGPTRPVARRPVGELGWSLVNHLALNHASLVGETPERAAQAVRTMLALYAPPEDAGWARQAEGVRGVQVRSAVRRLPFDGPLTFGTGVEIVLELDELAYQGSSAFLFASVLERFFARHAAINSFTQLTLRTPQRGEVMRWPPRIGQRETV